MTVVLAVAGGPAFRARVAAVLSSLPLSYAAAPVGAEPAGLAVALDGRGAWAHDALAAIEGRALGVVVFEPRPASPALLARLAATAEAARVPVRLARRWAGDPAVAALAGHPRQEDRTTLVESHARCAAATDLAQLLTAQLDLVCCAADGTAEVEGIALAADSYTAYGRLVGAGVPRPLMVSGVRTDAGRSRAVVRELLFRGRRSVAVGDGSTALAAAASVGDERGEALLPMVYETASRATLRALARDLARGAAATGDLDAFSAAASAAAAVLPEVTA